MLPVDRGFVRLSEGLVHYRACGQQGASPALPLYLAHAGPGSSRGLEPMLPALATDRFVLAPDTLGNGDSAPPVSDTVEIEYYAGSVIRILDALKIGRIDFYGSHTGAQIGCHLAVHHPERVRRLVLDGVPLFPADFKTQLLARYAPKMQPDDAGSQLAWAWHTIRDQSRFWPYFEQQNANRLDVPLPDAETLHLRVTDLLKALRTYHIAYRAAFSQDTAALLPQLRCPVLLMASELDPLIVYLDAVSKLVPHATVCRWSRTSTLAERVQAMNSFLSG